MTYHAAAAIDKMTRAFQPDLPCFDAPRGRPLPHLPAPHVADQRRIRGRAAYLSGLAAEDAVTRHYTGQGFDVVARRWRGSRAEIDLIVQCRDILVFVEVKKSRSFDAALMSLGRAQRHRITAAAGEFLASLDRHQMTDMRFDLAMMDGIGRLQIVENAFFEGE